VFNVDVKSCESLELAAYWHTAQSLSVVVRIINFISHAHHSFKHEAVWKEGNKNLATNINEM